MATKIEEKRDKINVKTLNEVLYFIVYANTDEIIINGEHLKELKKFLNYILGG